jgi:GT2 family glycosyltransferase
MAVVLSYDSPEGATHCVESLVGQGDDLVRILVIDNAGPRPVDPELAAIDPRVAVWRMPANTGPAGGHAEGVRRFLMDGADFAWIFDDDCVAAPGSLRQLLDDASGGPPKVVLASTFDADTGALDETHGWWGVLLPRSVALAVGLPDEDLFWWTEDTEYLQWRIPRAGFAVVRSKSAVVRVHRARASVEKPAWKYYYETRNQIHHRLRVQRPGPLRPIPRHLKLRVRAYRASKSTAKLLGRALLVERDERVNKSVMALRGTADGLLGRTGKRVDPDSSHRPSTTKQVGTA